MLTRKPGTGKACPLSALPQAVQLRTAKLSGPHAVIYSASEAFSPPNNVPGLGF